MEFLEAMHEAEIDLFHVLNRAGSSSVLDAVMIFFTVLGISYVIVLVCIPLWYTGRRESAFDVVLLVAVVTVLTEAIKIIVDRPRPLNELDDVSTILSASGPSFPSAHASRAFAVAALLCIRESWKVRAVAVPVAFLIALSRVYLGVHWPTDVLVGALLGIAVAALFELMSRRCGSYITTRKRIVGKLSRNRPSNSSRESSR